MTDNVKVQMMAEAMDLYLVRLTVLRKVYGMVSRLASVMGRLTVELKAH